MRDSVLHPSNILPLLVTTAAPTRNRLKGTDACSLAFLATEMRSSTLHRPHEGQSGTNRSGGIMGTVDITAVAPGQAPRRKCGGPHSLAAN